MSAPGYERRFRPVSEHDRSTPESRPSCGNVRFLGLEVRSTSDSRRRWARSAKTGFDPQRKFALLEEAEHWSLTPLRDKRVKIGAKVVAHGRYVTLQLAEVAVPKNLFQKFLSLIDDLRRRPAPAVAGKIEGQVKSTGGVCLDDGKYGQMTFRTQENRKIRPSIGCGENSVPSTVVRGYYLRNPGGHLGNVGLASGVGNFREGKS